ncbi:RHS repeat-associated core domain-containing protein [Streptomyces sp. NPDC019539]|uniref:RHS repeat-associated core domain-containing protein n=1 Tax=Streptomyces sp. NPDC019539 TaxID=3365063 RepID=UPI0037AAD7AA
MPWAERPPRPHATRAGGAAPRRPLLHTTYPPHHYNSHTDVETLTDENGNTKATYGYTAYGSDDKAEFTGIDKPEAADPTKEAYNPYRFNAKRWGAKSGTHDMGFRDYNPGLNRFTSGDMYNGALSDMGLGSDPYTGNRYACTGGNPVNFVEMGGHCFGWDACEDFFDDATDIVAGGAKKTGGGWLTAVNVLLDGIGWNTETAPNGYEYEPGDTPDYDRGLLTKADEVKEWRGADTMFPFQNSGCQDSRKSELCHMPLDGAGRSQGAIACLDLASDRPQPARQHSAGAAVPLGQARHLLDERTAGTTLPVTEVPADPQPDYAPSCALRPFIQDALVRAVSTPRVFPAVRAPARALGGHRLHPRTGRSR